jgi:hypothetical protein
LRLYSQALDEVTLAEREALAPGGVKYAGRDTVLDDGVAIHGHYVDAVDVVAHAQLVQSIPVGQMEELARNLVWVFERAPEEGDAKQPPGREAVTREYVGEWCACSAITDDDSARVPYEDSGGPVFRVWNG